MSISRRIADEQPDHFAFSAENKKRIKAIMAKYPKNRKASAVLPLLDLAQRQHDNWLPMKAIEAVANACDMPEIRVLEVASFYSMFNLKPVGKYFIQACGTTPCWLRGSDEVMRCMKDKLGIVSGQTSTCGKFTLLEVECLGACVNAPMVQINDDYYEDLDYMSMSDLIDRLDADDVPDAGSLRGRQGSQPEPEPTSLTNVVDFKDASTAKKTKASSKNIKAKSVSKSKSVSKGKGDDHA
ncbi:MAG: NADH-quinone oxidoreductase subunit E [Candidatus Puniceispirillum sp. TMED52]|nr:NADH-quinone oxidoreductase subunit NuoE [SAR116 cluster bacterium]OUU51202.1 MAG: NADH-quinone oxidoreductase subunit E [Candidatus Puniceispirillum sp. TMED52]